MKGFFFLCLSILPVGAGELSVSVCVCQAIAGG